ncbi:helix-turn-helix domain-containing protein [Saccharothrix sp. NPDC042600]|uniref:helix-turn-helix domain-containing protein n=1 Tax=Saccharothrix TaxID=2071 RepID=UPI0033FDD504|nr:hypothetical protein GCM10017745_52200 [Saccharothrix mutabilis subsp. capreolus]
MSDKSGDANVSASVLLNALADALAAASSVLRQHADAPSPRQATTGGSREPGAVDRARVVHPLLGPRQAEIIGLLEQAHPDGAGTGDLSRRMGYDEPNVHLALQALTGQGLVEKDVTTRPHRYRLSADLLRPGDQ